MPLGWELTSLGDLGEYLNGRAFSKSEWSEEGRPIIRIQDLTGTGNSPNYYKGELEERYVVRPGDLLVSWSATLGAFIWRGPEGCLNQHIFKVRSFVDRSFHYYLIRSILDDLYRQAHGSGMVHITKGKFEATTVSLPPLFEQRRIVAAIEEQFALLDAGVAALERTRANLKRYRASVLKAAVEGRLTERWREEHPDTEDAKTLLERILKERRARWEKDQLSRYAGKEQNLPKNWRTQYKEPAAIDAADLSELPKIWTWSAIEQVADVGTGATPLKNRADYYDGGTIPWVTSGALNSETVTQVEEHITEKALAETNAKLFPPGSLLVAMYGEGRTRGKVSELRINAATNQACAALVFQGYSKLVQPYAKLFLLSNYLDIRRQSAGGVQPNLNLSIVRRTALPLPPLAEQEEIVAEVERRLSVAEGVEAQVEAGLKRAARLRQAILKRAFEGRLVPQDPADEPAEALLERIRIERAAANGKPKRKGRARASRPSRAGGGGQAGLF